MEQEVLEREITRLNSKSISATTTQAAAAKESC